MMNINRSRRWTAFRLLPMLALAGGLGAKDKKMKREVRIHNPSTLSKPTGYSHVAEVTSGKMVYIAGQVALDKSGQLVGKDDFAAQVQQVFDNLNEALKSAGGSFADVLKLNYYCVDRVDRGQSPAVSAAEDLRLCAGPGGAEWLIEIEAVAAIEG